MTTQPDSIRVLRIILGVIFGVLALISFLGFVATLGPGSEGMTIAGGIYVVFFSVLAHACWPRGVFPKLTPEQREIHELKQQVNQMKEAQALREEAKRLREELGVPEKLSKGEIAPLPKK